MAGFLGVSLRKGSTSIRPGPQSNAPDFPQECTLSRHRRPDGSCPQPVCNCSNILILFPCKILLIKYNAKGIKIPCATERSDNCGGEMIEPKPRDGYGSTSSPQVFIFDNGALKYLYFLTKLFDMQSAVAEEWVKSERPWSFTPASTPKRRGDIL
jgi:hypothetical protein